MNAPPVQYVRTSDGYDIAYAVSGSGPPIVVLATAFEHVQLAWQYPALGDWLRALAVRFTVVQMDARGAGLSTRSLGADFAFEHYQRDIEAVVDHLRLDHMVIWGTIQGCFLAARYAIDNPARVRALILTRPTGMRAPLEAIAEQNWDLTLHTLVPRERSPEEARRQVELLKQSFDPENFVRRARAAGEVDLLDLCERVVTPTLVLHPRDYALADVSDSIHVAQVLGASLSVIDGSYVFGDVEPGIRAIQAFLKDTPSLGPAELPAKAPILSPREAEVLRLIAAGKSNPQIAAELVISLNTVQRHVSNILAKTGANNRTEAAIYARDRGLA
jgi:DNA-binding CsgD family transcriptional regulator/pimeloyl-ACP methyl ester carboxylesterase